jgi:protein pelota
MTIDMVVIAGPGFMKDDLKKHLETKGVRLEKKVVYVAASDAERSGIREAVQSAAVAKLLEGEKMKREFDALNAFLGGLAFGHSFAGAKKVRAALEEYGAGMVLVNDSVLNDREVKDVLDIAYGQRVEILVFNSEDDAGTQLHGFKDIAAIGKSFAKK